MEESKRVEIDKSIFYLDGEGEYHRDGGPACEYGSGDAEWYQHGKLDRKDGPARSLVDGTKQWFREGALHRGDGPAVQKSDQSEEWWCCGFKLPAAYKLIHMDLCQKVDYRLLKEVAEKVLGPLRSQAQDLNRVIYEDLLAELSGKERSSEPRR